VIDYSIIDLDWHGKMVEFCIQGALEFVEEQSLLSKNAKKVLAQETKAAKNTEKLKTAKFKIGK